MGGLEEVEREIKEVKIEIITLMKEKQAKIAEAKRLEEHLWKKRQLLSALYAKVKEFNRRLARG